MQGNYYTVDLKTAEMGLKVVGCRLLFHLWRLQFYIWLPQEVNAVMLFHIMLQRYGIATRATLTRVGHVVILVFFSQAAKWIILRGFCRLNVSNSW